MHKILIISAHADDETFGMGATLKKLSKQKDVELHWLIMTKIGEPHWSAEQVQKRSKEINEISSLFDFKSTTQWKYLDNQLEMIPLSELQKKMIDFLDKLKPETLYCPGPWDFNHEHKLAFQVVEMSSKPFYSDYLKTIYSYEIPSSTEWKFKSSQSFSPNHYVNINSEINDKVEAIKIYEDEVYPFPHPRSDKYITSLANIRGAEIGIENAEAFVLIRQRAD